MGLIWCGYPGFYYFFCGYGKLIDKIGAGNGCHCFLYVGSY